MTDRTVGEYRYICSACTNINQGHTQFTLIVCQYGQAGSQRIEHQLVYFQATAAHTFDDVFSGTLCTGDDMHFGF